jgi:hypothetical protein
MGENLLETFGCRVYVMDEGRGIYGSPYLLREVTKKEEEIIVFNLIAGSAKVINSCGKAGSSVCSWQSMTEKAPSKSFEERWNGFGFPDSIKDVMCVRGNCSGTYRR